MDIVKGDKIGEILDEIDKFGFRYLAINCMTHYESLGKDFNLPPVPYFASHCIFDYDEGKVIFFCANETKGSRDPWGKSFALPKRKTLDLSFLDPYKVDDSYFYQMDKVNPNMKKLNQMYGIGHIWLACVYTAKSGTKRMVINSNLFGRIQDIGTREFNLQKLLQD